MCCMHGHRSLAIITSAALLCHLFTGVELLFKTVHIKLEPTGPEHQFLGHSWALRHTMFVFNMFITFREM